MQGEWWRRPHPSWWVRFLPQEVTSRETGSGALSIREWAGVVVFQLDEPLLRRDRRR
jgi:hypothetical protein